MDGLGLFSVYSLLLYSSIKSTKAEVYFDESQVTVKERGDVTLVCTVVGFHPTDVIQIEKLGPSEERSLLVSENEFVKSPFVETGRYFASNRYNEVTAIATVTIMMKEVLGMDRGQFQCKRLSRIDEKAIIYVDVQVPVKSLDLVLLTDMGISFDVSSGATIPLEQGRMLGFSCVGKIDGLSYGPEMRFYLEDEDVTHLLEKKNISVESDQVFGGQPSSEVTLTYRTDKPPRDYHNKRMYCSARTDGYPALEVYGTIEVIYPPVLRCNEKAHAGATDEVFFATCDLWANPDAFITWYYEDTGGSKTAIKDHPDYATGFRASTEVVEEDHSRVNLHFYKLSEAHQLKYWVEAQNEKGSASAWFTIYTDVNSVDERSDEDESSEEEIARDHQPDLSVQPGVSPDPDPSPEVILKVVTTTWAPTYTASTVKDNLEQPEVTPGITNSGSKEVKISNSVQKGSSASSINVAHECIVLQTLLTLTLILLRSR